MAAGGSGGAACPANGAGGAPAVRPDSIVFMPNVTVTTLAGGGTAGAQDGVIATATFGNPVSVVIEAAGTLLVCDFDNDRIRRIDVGTGMVSTLTAQTGFQRPFGFAYGQDGTLYVHTDANPSGVKNNTTGTIWRVDSTSGAATMVATNLGRPRGLAALAGGSLALADYQNARVRLLDPASTLVSDLAGRSDCPGFADGQGTAARFLSPYAVVVMPGGDLLMADMDNHVLRTVALDGTVSPFAGDGGAGTIDGARLQARFDHPKAMAIDAAGNVYISDSGAGRIRRVAADGTVTTVAGNGTDGFQDGTGAQAAFYAQEGIAVSADGTTVYVADGSGGDIAPFHRIRKITIGP